MWHVGEQESEYVTDRFDEREKEQGERRLVQAVNLFQRDYEGGGRR